jgi:hypothetical protein
MTSFLLTFSCWGGPKLLASLPGGVLSKRVSLIRFQLTQWGKRGWR